MEECPNKQRVGSKQVFLRLMRYVSVFSVTIVVTIMAIMCSGLDGFDLDLALFCFILIFTYLFFITLPIIGFWIYSFIKSIKRRTKTDCLLLYFHIVDLILLGLIIYLDVSRGELDCNAELMAEHYEIYGYEMRNVANQAREMLPDCGGKIVYELGDSIYVSHEPVPSYKQLDKLKEQIEGVGCIGIETDNRGKSDCTTIRFRRIGMGMYSFRLYDRPLTRNQQDSINADPCLIVYNDSTVFEFGGGVFGVQHFVGKDEFLKSRNKKLIE